MHRLDATMEENKIVEVRRHSLPSWLLQGSKNAGHSYQKAPVIHPQTQKRKYPAWIANS